MLSTTQEAKMPATRQYVETLRAEQAELITELQALQSGYLHIGNPYEGRTEARIYDRQRKIADYQQIIDRLSAQIDNCDAV
jgi:hypothetical protein